MSKTKERTRVLIEATTAGAVGQGAEMLRAIVRKAVAQRNVCYLALAGGTTPRAMYDLLAKTALSGDDPWPRVHVFLGDERDVQQDHIESNYYMVQRALLDHLPIPPTNVHPMRGDAGDLQAAATEYEGTIRQIVGGRGKGLPRFDLVLLGMGADGHTASLFPGSTAVDETQKLVVACRVDVLGRQRMTITFPLINAARNVMLLVTGDDKAQAAACLLGKTRADAFCRDMPALRIAPTDGEFIIVLDADAARLTGLRAES